MLLSGGHAENRVERLTWDVVSQRLAARAAAILPVGAAAKEHGLHLPMDTDRLQAEWLAGQLAVHIDALVWPTVTYGYYPAFVNYAGSVMLSASVFESLIREIVGELLRYGARKVFVLDTGISTIPVIERAVEGLQCASVCHLRVHDGPRYRNAHAAVLEQAWGGHADEAETSRMLALAPDRVELARAQASPERLKERAPGPLTPADSEAPNYSASGSVGDPRGATSAKGEILLAAMLDDLIATARAALVFLT